MKKLLLLCITATFVHGAPSPQYSGDDTIDDAALADTIAEILGTNGKQTDASYGGTSADLNQDQSNVDVLVQVVKESFPNDYVADSEALVEEKATVEVDTIYENCADYTEEFCYMCVPYYQCSLSLMEEICRMTLLCYSQMGTLFLTNTLTQPVFQPQEMSMMDPHALLLDGARMSLELLVSIKLFSRRLTFQWSAMEYARTN